MNPSFAPGARNAVRACLNIGSGDRVAIIQDVPRAAIGEAIAEEAQLAGADVRAFTMETYLERPARNFPRSLAEEIRAFRPTASFYVGTGMKGELAFRQPMRELLVKELKVRHGHMIGIDERVMVQGMAGDYEEIYRVTRQVWEIARQASRIEVQTRLGTDLKATFSPDRRWISSDGRLWEQGQWSNLPDGETFTAPLSVDGILAGEELGDHFTEKYGLLPAPVRIEIRGGRFVAAHTPDAGLRAEIEEYMGQHPNSSRVGEFAIGTNVGLKAIVGNFLQDEKFPGVHIAFGDPYGAETGADWKAPSHVDVLASQATVAVDGRRIMEDGKILA